MCVSLSVCLSLSLPNYIYIYIYTHSDCDFFTGEGHLFNPQKTPIGMHETPQGNFTLASPVVHGTSKRTVEH